MAAPSKVVGKGEEEDSGNGRPLGKEGFDGTQVENEA